MAFFLWVKGCLWFYNVVEGEEKLRLFVCVESTPSERQVVWVKSEEFL